MSRNDDESTAKSIVLKRAPRQPAEVFRHPPSVAPRSSNSSELAPSEKPLEVRLNALALSLALELDGSLERDSITTIEYLSSEACRDLANARNGMRDLREALREALRIAWARGHGEFRPAHAVRLSALEAILAGWSE